MNIFSTEIRVPEIEMSAKDMSSEQSCTVTDMKKEDCDRMGAKTRCMTKRRGGQVTLDRIKGLDSAVMKHFMIHSNLHYTQNLNRSYNTAIQCKIFNLIDSI